MTESKTDKLKITIKIPQMYGYIYSIQNKLDGKYYIGQRKSTTIQDSYFGSGVYLNNAIKKHGKENFKKEILAICDNQEQLDNREIWFIEHAKSRVEYDNYNLTDGGDGLINPSQVVRDKISKNNIGKNMGKENGNSRQIINLDTLEVFDSIMDATRKYNLKTINSIYYVCAGKWVSSAGYKWAYYDEYLAGTNPIRERKPTGGQAPCEKVINLDTLEVFDSTGDAGEKYNISYKSIWRVCAGKRKTTGGYRWQYYNDYLKEQSHD